MITSRRQVVCGLALALYCLLLPGPSFGFSFTALDGNGIPIPDQTTGVPITWANSSVDVSVGFGDFPQGFTASNGTGSWDENAQQALGEWTDVDRSNFQFNGTLQVGDVCALGDGEVSSGWAGNNCGQGFGDIIAVTRVVWQIVGNRAEVHDADIIFNNTLNWDAYDGSTRTNQNGEVVYDFRRTVLHEYGHVLGLGHPDGAGQNVFAVMNSTASPGSGPDRLTDDDKNGAIALYGNFQSSGGASSFDVGLAALLLLVLTLRNRCNRKSRIRGIQLPAPDKPT